MARIVDKSIPLSVERATARGTSIPYAGLGSVQALADLIIAHQAVLRAVASFAANNGRLMGYSRENLSNLRARVMALFTYLPNGVAKKTIGTLDGVATDYTAILDDPPIPPEAKANLAGDFTAGISEAVVYKLLVNNGRLAQDVVLDTMFFQGEKKLTACNVDFFSTLRRQKVAELYECKNQPRRLLERYDTRNVAGNEPDWKREKLYLMLTVHELLTTAKWRVHLGCVTFRTRSAIQDALSPFGTPPAELTIYCQEDLGTTFPPSLPN